VEPAKTVRHVNYVTIHNTSELSDNNGGLSACENAEFARLCQLGEAAC
jgi:hypothetical protein